MLNGKDELLMLSIHWSPGATIRVAACLTKTSLMAYRSALRARLRVAHAYLASGSLGLRINFKQENSLSLRMNLCSTCTVLIQAL